MNHTACPSILRAQTSAAHTVLKRNYLRIMKRSCTPETQQKSNKQSTTARNGESLNLSSLNAPVSPPQRRSNRLKDTSTVSQATASLAAIEAGEEKVTDHLRIISTKLAQCTRPSHQQTFRLPIDEWVDLYKRNEHLHGHHFVIHQHDHPIAGPHYDLRLQFSETSSVSWAVMYGMPGDPNSERLNRNATETRIHCLWNHLIETASPKTGSMIIWDTGEYEILPYRDPEPETDDSRSDTSEDTLDHIPDSVKLQEAFKNRKIRVRLHGTRLPQNYTLLLRMDKSSDYTRPLRQGAKRRRKRNKSQAPADLDFSSGSDTKPHLDPLPDTDPRPLSTHNDDVADLEIQINNAYPGSKNSIGSVHQRRWWLSLDRSASGLQCVNGNDDNVSQSSRGSTKTWVRTPTAGHGFPFYVHGPEIERSVITGRLGADVLVDEGVAFVARRGWRAVLD